MDNKKEVITEVAEKKVNPFKRLINAIKNKQGKKVKSQFLLKRGGYSLAITALVLAAIILLNWLVSSLATRFHLDFDMSAQKLNTMSEENIEYIKNVEDEVIITLFGTESEYVNEMNYYSQKIYAASGSPDYFLQTVNFAKKYAEYNKKITVRYIGFQDNEIYAVQQLYPNIQIMPGDIIVSGNNGDTPRMKHIAFRDIYTLTDENGYAAAGYGYYTISSNNIETVLTGAIDYVCRSEIKKIAMLTGHSTNDYTKSYQELLESNNYEVDIIADAIITEIPKEYDAIVLMAPNLDLIGSEIDAISEFLDNDGKLSKSLIFFGDATCPALPTLYEFLEQWGISVSEGILFETDTGKHISGDPNAVFINVAKTEDAQDEDEETKEKDDDITKGINVCVADYNVPMSVCNPSDLSITSTAIMQTSDSVVAAPISSGADYSDYTDADIKIYDSIIQSCKDTYDDDNNLIASYVMAFSSVEYIDSTWSSYSDLSNQDITLAVTDRAAGAESDIKFTSKTITDESFANSVSASGSLVIRMIFVVMIPILIVAAGIYIYIRRKNAQ